MSSKAWYPRYVGDLLADTMDFDALEYGAYSLLMDHYWANQGPISSDPNELRKICRVSPHVFRKISSKILHKFVLQNEKYFLPRMDREIAKAVDLSQKRSDAGKLGAAANATANVPAIADTTTTTTTEEHSVNKLTGADAPEIDEREEAKKRLWNTAKQKLQINGGVIGKAIKKYGEHAVACAVEETDNKSPADPTSFFLGLLKANPKTGAQAAWQRMPYDNEKLTTWADKHGFSPPPIGASWEEYRSKLNSEITLRKDKAA